MASSFQSLLFCSFWYLTHISQSHSFPLPNPLLLPITKDITTLQYVTNILHGTLLVPVKLVVDLGGPLIWTDCASRFASSSSRPIPNRSIKCSRAKAHACPSSAQTCELSTENGITRMATRGELVEDIVAVQSIDGSKATVDQFVLSCVPTFLLNGLASGAKGMIGLGRTRISLPSQISTALDTHQKFTICLSSSDGIIVLSDQGPHDSVFGSEISRSAMFTPLASNSLQEHLIGVKSIKINGKRLSLNASLLSLDGWTRLSTIVPYTTMESTIYATLIKAYIQAAASLNMTRVASVAPFGLCFSSKGIDLVPTIDLVLQSEMVKWRIFGRNSMVRVNDQVMCLGFLDGGLNPRNSIVLGGYQLEDILLQFDLGTSMLGFTPSLLMRQRTCSDFKLDSSPKDSL